MNNKELKKLKEIYNFLTEGINDIKRENVFICLSGDISTEKENKYINCNNKQLTPFVKFTGSKRAYLLRAEEMILNLINNKTVLK